MAMSLMWRGAAALGAMGAVAIGGWHWATQWRPAPATYAVQGIDLPAAPGPVEWGEVRGAGADFAYLTATTGRDRAPAFEEMWNALPAHGLRRGAVHVFDLCQPAAVQANAFNTTVPRAEDALPAAVDIDLREGCDPPSDPRAATAALARFVAMVEAHTGKPVLLRISRAAERVYGVSAALRRPNWQVANFVAPDYAARPWRLWRASDLRRIDGVEGAVNWDVVRP